LFNNFNNNNYANPFLHPIPNQNIVFGNNNNNIPNAKRRRTKNVTITSSSPNEKNTNKDNDINYKGDNNNDNNVENEKEKRQDPSPENIEINQDKPSSKSIDILKDKINEKNADPTNQNINNMHEDNENIIVIQNEEELIEFRNSMDYQTIQRSYLLVFDEHYNIAIKMTCVLMAVDIPEHMKSDHTRISKMIEDNNQYINKSKIITKVARKKNGEIAEIIRNKLNTTETKYIDYLMKYHPNIFGNENKIQSRETFVKAKTRAFEYLELTGLWENIIFSNLSYDKIKRIGFKKTIRILNDLKERGYMADPSNSLYFYAMTKQEIMECITSSSPNIKYFQPHIEQSFKIKCI